MPPGVALQSTAAQSQALARWPPTGSQHSAATKRADENRECQLTIHLVSPGVPPLPDRARRATPGSAIPSLPPTSPSRGEAQTPEACPKWYGPGSTRLLSERLAADRQMPYPGACASINPSNEVDQEPWRWSYRQGRLILGPANEPHVQRPRSVHTQRTARRIQGHRQAAARTSSTRNSNTTNYRSIQVLHAR